MVALAIGVPVAVVVALGVVLAVEAQQARSREYVEDPDFDIDRTVPGAAPTLELAVLGDSTVAGLGVSHVRDTLPVQVARELARRTGRAVHVVGYGVSGAVTRDVLREQLPKVGDVDVIVVEVGSNDVTHATRTRALEHDTRELLRRAGTRARVVVLGGSGRLDTHNFRRPLRDLVMWRARGVRRLQGRLVRAQDHDRYGFVDIGGAVGDEYGRTSGANSSDGFHPAAPGYAVWARALGREAAERL